MIVTLQEAQQVAPEVTELDLNAIEAMVREYTNNEFQDRARRLPIWFTGPNEIQATSKDFTGYRPGDTIQIIGSEYNDGLYTLESTDGQTAIVAGENPFIEATRQWHRAEVLRIEYPADIKRGVLKILEYDAIAADRIGLKSRSVARMSETYADPGQEGYPAHLLGFLNKYRRMRWE